MGHMEIKKCESLKTRGDNVINLKLKCIFLLSLWWDNRTAYVLESEAIVDFLSSLHTM